MKTICTQIRSASFVFYGICLLCLTTAIASPAQTFKTLLSFDGTNGAGPYGDLIQASNGKLYGTASRGGANGWGTVFQIGPSGQLKTIYNFAGMDGAVPTAGLIQANNGKLYGTTADGGAVEHTCVQGCGTVFQIAPSGKLKTIHSFDRADGFDATSDLIQASNGKLYGITWHGGANGNYGTVFQIAPSGKLTTLYNFCSQPNCTDGANPTERLVQATDGNTDGNFYGTTTMGGDNDLGTVFQITPSGELTKLYDFAGMDGANPYAGLVQASDGNLYGTTRFGGISNNGTVFRITLSGELTKLYDFAGTDGAHPYADLIQASNGKLYGTTLDGGDNGFGTVFRITLSGELKTLHSFDNSTDGAHPYGDLVQASNRKLYGTTYAGGANGGGTVFSLS